MSQLIAHELMTLGAVSPRIGVDGCRMPDRYPFLDAPSARQLGTFGPDGGHFHVVSLT